MFFAELSLYEITIILIMVLAAGFLKGVTGLGLPLIMTPPLASVFGIQTAVLLVSVPVVITNLAFIGKYHQAWRDVVKFWPMVLTGLIALVGGVYFLQYGDQQLLTIILSLLAIGYVLLNLLGFELKVSADKLPIFGPVFGAVGGFFHGTTGVSGPVVIAYLASIQGITRAVYFQALGFIFLIFGLQQVLGYVVSGLYTLEILQMGLIVTIPVLGSFFLGNKLQQKLDAKKFERVTFLLIFISSLNLLISNL